MIGIVVKLDPKVNYSVKNFKTDNFFYHQFKVKLTLNLSLLQLSSFSIKTYTKISFRNSHSCVPGGGYFRNDENVEKFDRYAIFTEFRDDLQDNGILVPEEVIDDFLHNPENFHLLDGFTEGQKIS